MESAAADSRLPVDELLANSQDTVDYVTLDELAALQPEELVVLELPPPWKPGRRYRCLSRSSLANYAMATANRIGVREGGADGSETGRLLVVTYLPGVELDERDLEYVLRALERPAVAGAPVLLHVARVVEASADDVLSRRHETSVHIYELAEAMWERELWQLFDRAFVPTSTVCPSGHQLQCREEGAGLLPRTVICDHCERTLLGGEQYRCGRGCDFDLCGDCYRRGGLGTDSLQWLQEKLDTFWEAHPDFQLPLEPARQFLGAPLLSSAVTKFNNFATPLEEALRLRRCFLRSLSAHGANIATLKNDFWPGCAAQRQLVERYMSRVSGSHNLETFCNNAAPAPGAVVTAGSDLLMLSRQHSGCGQLWSVEAGSEIVVVQEEKDAEDADRANTTGADKTYRRATLASSDEALRFHFRKAATELDPAWTEEDFVEFAYGVAAAAAGASLALPARWPDGTRPDRPADAALPRAGGLVAGLLGGIQRRLFHR